jgi:hypothetical protein
MKKLLIGICLLCATTVCYGADSTHGFLYSAQEMPLRKEKWRQDVKSTNGAGAFAYCVNSKNTAEIIWASSWGYGTVEAAQQAVVREILGTGFKCLKEPAWETTSASTLRRQGY